MNAPEQLTLFPFIEQIDRKELPQEADIQKDLMAFWYGSIQGTIKPTTAQLKASEHLAKALKMFVESKEIDNTVTIIGGLPDNYKNTDNFGISITNPDNL